MIYQLRHKSVALLEITDFKTFTSKEDVMSLLRQFNLDTETLNQLVREGDEKAVPDAWDNGKKLDKIAEYIIAGNIVITQRHNPPKVESSAAESSMSDVGNRSVGLGSGDSKGNSSSEKGTSNKLAAPGKKGIDSFRQELKGLNPEIDDDIETIGVANTDVPGLENALFKGASPKVRKTAGLPPTTPGPVKTNIDNPFFKAHAEEDIANQFIADVETAGLKPEDLAGKNLNLTISNPAGLCPGCSAGLKPTSKAKNPGVIKQLSERYPELNINIDIPGRESFSVLGGKIVS
jgi:hypothetical protein